MEPSFKLSEATCGRLNPELVLFNLIPSFLPLFLAAFQRLNSRMAKPGKKGPPAAFSLGWDTGFPSMEILSSSLFLKQWPRFAKTQNLNL